MRRPVSGGIRKFAGAPGAKRTKLASTRAKIDVLAVEAIWGWLLLD
jgi:hypothetical protein